MESPVDVSYLADTLIMLRFFEFDGAVKRALSVLKHRKGAYETPSASSSSARPVFASERLCIISGCADRRGRV